MKTKFFAATKLFAAAFLLLLGSAAQAQATRTWVSGVGDDANPCTRTAPCKTFAGAISKTAAGGTISVLDPGGFGAVTITKSITIEGTGAVASILASGTQGVIINAAPTDRVVLRDLSIDGSGPTLGTNGVRILSAMSVLIERCTIQDFSTTGVDVATSSNVVIRDTLIANIRGAGMQSAVQAAAASGAAVVELERVRIHNSGRGVFTRANGRVNSQTVLVSGSDTGFQADGLNGVSTQFLQGSSSAQNIVGIIAAGSANASITIADTTITGNTTGIDVAAGANVVSFGDNRIAGNGSNGGPTQIATKQ